LDNGVKGQGILQDTTGSIGKASREAEKQHGNMSKVEFRNPNFETISNAQNPNDRSATQKLLLPI
jgi:hypothetical protein